AATARGGGVPLVAAELAEVLSTWDVVTRPLHDLSDVLAWLAERSGVHESAVEHLASVRGTLVRPGSAPWPSPGELQHVLTTARDLRRRLGLH
ncbi:sel1 repeat family protein, partial [Nonomuraea fuscirosea]